MRSKGGLRKPQPNVWRLKGFSMLKFCAIFHLMKPMFKSLFWHVLKLEWTNPFNDKTYKWPKCGHWRKQDVFRLTSWTTPQLASTAHDQLYWRMRFLTMSSLSLTTCNAITLNFFIVAKKMNSWLKSPFVHRNHTVRKKIKLCFSVGEEFATRLTKIFLCAFTWRVLWNLPIFLKCWHHNH